MPSIFGMSIPAWTVPRMPCGVQASDGAVALHRFVMRARVYPVQRLLNYVVPEAVHIMEAGKIIHSGGIEVADILEKDGYEGIKALIRKAEQQQQQSGRQAVPA
jgi:hypothetical protein